MPKRSLTQPGPVDPIRIDLLHDEARVTRLPLYKGTSLNAALTQTLDGGEWRCGTATLAGTVLEPFRYVMPGPPTDDAHVAYFSAPVSPKGPVTIEQANATLGWSGDEPFIHCHAVWREADGTRRGGHILPHESFIAARADAEAWCFKNLIVQAEPDEETGFTLFQPRGFPCEGNAVLARVKPNQDIVRAVERIARHCNMPNATVRGSLGSLIGARFEDGRGVSDIATEVLVRRGKVRGSVATLDVLVADMKGGVHQGQLVADDNPVCITFDIILTAGL